MMGSGLSTDRLAVNRARYPQVVLIALLVAACGASPAAPPVTPQPVAPTSFETLPPLYGTGVITFGNKFDPNTLKIIGPTSVFKASAKRIAWSAALRTPAGATTLTWILAKVTAGGAETTVFKQDADVSNPDFDTLANAIDLGLLLSRKPGTYVMRYLRDSDVLAEGKFTLVK